MITQDELKEYLSYDKETGVFVWLRKPCARVSVGDIAGSKNSKGYLIVGLKSKRFRAHRLAWLYVYGEFPKDGLEIDHIDRDKSNNRINNLRVVTRSQNQMNKGLQSNNSTGVHGVSFSKRVNKYKVLISFNKKQKLIGYFDSIHEASAAYESALEKYYGGLA